MPSTALGRLAAGPPLKEDSPLVALAVGGRVRHPDQNHPAGAWPGEDSLTPLAIRSGFITGIAGDSRQ